jgi:hypothetical protein
MGKMDLHRWRPGHGRSCWLIVTLAAGLSACGAEEKLSGNVHDEVTVTPATLEEFVGARKFLITASVRLSQPFDLTTMHWTSSSPGIVALEAPLVVAPPSSTVGVGPPPAYSAVYATCLAVGSSVVTAGASGAGESSASVTCTLPFVHISPSGVTLDVGEFRTFSCELGIGSNMAGSEIGFDDMGTFTWSIANSGIASVTSTGRVTGVSPGNTTVKCTSDKFPSQSASAPVGVVGGNYTETFKPGSVAVNKGSTATVGVTATDPNGNPANVNVQVSSADPSVATATAQGSTITVTGVSEGTTEVTATVSETSGSAFIPSAALLALGVHRFKVSVLGTAAKVAIQPNPVNLAVGGTQQLSVSVNGSPGTTRGYFSYNTSVARVDPLSGVVTGVGAGSTLITSGATQAESTNPGGATLVNVTGAAQACLAAGTYSFAAARLFDPYFADRDILNVPASVPLTVTINGTSVTFTGPAPFIGGTGTIDTTCRISLSASGTLYGIPNVGVLLSGALPASGSSRLVYEVGTNGTMPNNYPIYYSLVK